MENPNMPNVKMSADLPYGLYLAVQEFPREAGIPQATGRSRIPSSEIFRALVEELAANEYLRDRVTKRIIEASNAKHGGAA